MSLDEKIKADDADKRVQAQPGAVTNRSIVEASRFSHIERAMATGLEHVDPTCFGIPRQRAPKKPNNKRRDHTLIGSRGVGDVALPQGDGDMHEELPASKVFYRPIEAAIRWAGLWRYSQEILSSISSPRNLPRTLNCPRWDELRLCTERIYDAIVNGELPYGRNGITLNDESLLDSHELTVRHLDLKHWMQTHYPGHRPAFLFSRIERIAHPVITLEAGQAMLVERQAMKAELELCRRELRNLKERHEELLKQSGAIPACGQCSLSDRAEATYLHIIGSMLELMLSRSPSGKPYSCFSTQEAIVSALIAHRGGIMGITERTLNGKFASARRKLGSASVVA